MSSSLFRKEALEHRKDRLYGDVVLLQPLSMTILVSAVVVICMLILTILFWGTYARKESVHGYLLPDKGIVKTYAPQAGVTIAKVHVREGDEVTEGQVLITLLSERSIQGGSDIDTLQLQEIESSLSHQLERINGEKTLLTAQAAQLQQQMESLKTEIGQISQNLKTQQDKVHILESRVEAGKKLLDSKNISQLEYQKMVEELINQKQRYQELLSAKSSKESTIIQAKSELEQLPIKSKSRINELENNISELKQRQAEIKGRRSLEIRAPITGTITGIQAREGQTATNNAPLLAIIPKGAVMQAELFVPSRAIGFISPGQTVRIRYEAFPYQRFGIYEGKVTVISKHVLLPQELPIPLELKEPVYRVTVLLSQQNVMAYGKDFPLQAGMSLDADIILEKQTLFKWILDPIISLKGRF
ncbi:MAG: HlyD family efflux transporter periplasmic adaptor subunit [Proteobacteria bacterium]|nr:HlyD family efflux transporter periplasmic adaptor subunit [Pseudomonadota bacterium]